MPKNKYMFIATGETQQKEDSAEEHMTFVKLEKVGREAKNQSGSTFKFWHGWVKGETVYTHWGRKGTKGQQKSYQYLLHSKAIAQLMKKYRSKVEKGYIVTAIRDLPHL